MASLVHMQYILSDRQLHFPSVEKAVGLIMPFCESDIHSIGAAAMSGGHIFGAL
jgi:hypothetical protein